MYSPAPGGGGDAGVFWSFASSGSPITDNNAFDEQVEAGVIIIPIKCQYSPRLPPLKSLAAGRSPIPASHGNFSRLADGKATDSAGAHVLYDHGPAQDMRPAEQRLQKCLNLDANRQHTFGSISPPLGFLTAGPQNPPSGALDDRLNNGNKYNRGLKIQLVAIEKPNYVKGQNFIFTG